MNFAISKHTHELDQPEGRAWYEDSRWSLVANSVYLYLFDLAINLISLWDIMELFIAFRSKALKDYRKASRPLPEEWIIMAFENLKLDSCFKCWVFGSSCTSVHCSAVYALCLSQHKPRNTLSRSLNLLLILSPGTFDSQRPAVDTWICWQITHEQNTPNNHMPFSLEQGATHCGYELLVLTKLSKSTRNLVFEASL